MAATSASTGSGPAASPPSSSSHMHHGMSMPSSSPPAAAASSAANFTEDGLIVPRKLMNPCLESRERIDLHRELRFNVKALVLPDPSFLVCCCCCVAAALLCLQFPPVREREKSHTSGFMKGGGEMLE